MPFQSIKARYLTLFLLAVICGVIWRTEVEYHGWAGLIWLDYYHYSVPISVILFIGWANLLFPIPMRKRLLMVLVGGLLAMLLFYWLTKFLYVHFNMGPSAMIMHMQMGGVARFFYGYGIFILVPLFPVATYLLMCFFGYKIHWKHVLISIAIIIASVPIGLFILERTNHIGGADLIHLIKTGILVPFWVFAFGNIVARTKEL